MVITVSEQVCCSRLIHTKFIPKQWYHIVKLNFNVLIAIGATVLMVKAYHMTKLMQNCWKFDTARPQSDTLRLKSYICDPADERLTPVIIIIIGETGECINNVIFSYYIHYCYSI